MPEDVETRFRAYLDSEDFYRYVRAICSKILIALTIARSETIEDAVIDILVKAWSARHTFKAAPTLDEETYRQVFKGWIAQIARNHCLDIRKKRQEVLQEDHSVPEVSTDPFAEITGDLAIRSCLGRLAEEDLEAYETLILQEVEGFKQEEVMRILGVTLRVVQTGVARAKRKMKKCLVSGTDS